MRKCCLSLVSSHHTNTITQIFSKCWIFPYHEPLKWSCPGDSDSNSCFQQNCSQIMVSNFQNIYKLFPCLDNWQNPRILGSEFPIHFANIAACGTTVGSDFINQNTRNHVFVHVLSTCKQLMPLCFWACPWKSILPLWATLGIEPSMFISSSYMMSSCSFPPYKMNISLV